MPTSKLRSNIEMVFIMIAMFAAFGVVLYLLREHDMIVVVVQTISPLVAFWLWKFYQNTYSEKDVNLIYQITFGVTCSLAFLTLLRANHIEVSIDKLILNGHAHSKMVEMENDEGGTYEERKSFFTLSDNGDQWKKEAISWYVWFLIIGVPVININLMFKLKPKVIQRGI